MLPVKLKLSSFAISLKFSPRRVEHIVAKKNSERSQNLAACSRDGVRVGAAQVEVRRYRTLAEYVEDMDRYVAKAVHAGAQIVAFPHGCGLLPIGITPYFDTLLEELQRVKDNSEELTALLLQLLDEFSSSLQEIFLTTFSALAKAYGVYIMAGSTYVLEGDNLYCRSYLLDENGLVLGTQDLLHRSPLEKALGVVPGEEIRVFDTKAGRVAILIGQDGRTLEPLRIARGMGAEIILSPSGSLTPRQESLADWGYKAAADALAVYIAAPVLSGTMGVRFCGRAACYGPLNITKERDGIVNQVICDDAGGLIVSRLNLEQLYAGFDAYTGDSNPEFIKTQLMSAYQKLTKRL